MSTQRKSKSAPKTADAAVKAATETYEHTLEAAKEQVEKAGVAVTQGYGDFASLQKDSVDAFVATGAILAKGFETLSKEYFAFAQEAATANNEAAKALLSAKSIEEVVELQSELVRATFDKSLSESGKLSEMSLKIANEAFEPVQKQLTVAVEAAMKPLAA